MKKKTSFALPAALLVCVVIAGAVVATIAPWEDDVAPSTLAPGPPPREAPVAGAGRLAGYVRDVNEHPVPDARVWVAGDESRQTRADARGRYKLRVPGQSVTIVAEHPAYAPQQVELPNRPSGGRLDFSLAATDAAAAGPNSADRIIFWTGCEQIAGLGEKGLDRLTALGVDGFVCSIGRLPSMGGEHAFSVPEPEQDETHNLQRALASSAAVRRAKAGEIKLYLGFYASNARNLRTPFEEWFDDDAWSRLLPEVRELAAAARSLAFSGVAVDHELYSFSENADPSWSWAYPGNERPEAEVRAMVRQRGSELMRALLAGYPGIEVAAYDVQLPESWSAKVQEVVNDIPDEFATDTRIDLWDGLSSVPGYSAIRWFDATFYKTPHLSEDWSTGLQYNANRVYSLLSRRFSNWSYASSRLHVSPFSWIDKGPLDFEAVRSPDYVAAQLAAFREWGTGGTFANYAYGSLEDFDYERFGDGLQQASTPEVVDRRPPELLVGSPAVADELSLRGTATGDRAIRVVRWYDDQGRFGTAQLDWQIDGGDIRKGWEWTTHWRLEGVPAPPGRTRLTIVAEDIKGLASTRTLSVTP